MSVLDDYRIPSDTVDGIVNAVYQKLQKEPNQPTYLNPLIVRAQAYYGFSRREAEKNVINHLLDSYNKFRSAEDDTLRLAIMSTAYKYQNPSNKD